MRQWESNTNEGSLPPAPGLFTNTNRPNSENETRVEFHATSNSVLPKQ